MGAVSGRSWAGFGLLLGPKRAQKGFIVFQISQGEVGETAQLVAEARKDHEAVSKEALVKLRRTEELAAQRRQHQLRLWRPAPSHGQVDQNAKRHHPSCCRVCYVPSNPQAWIPAAQQRQRQLRLRRPAPSHGQVEQNAKRHHPSRWRRVYL